MASIALLDIEGTIADIAFVKQVLFPYARRALPDFIEAHADEPQVAAELSATAQLAGVAESDRDAIVTALIGWIDADRKATPLKTLQGMVWKSGYEQGDFTAHLYPDALAWLKQAHADGFPLYVYSSGSVAAQKLYFSFSDYGDILEWFDGFFDTTTGPKKDVGSYYAIAELVGRPAGEIAFFSDLEAELDAAAGAGMKTVQIVRAGTEAGSRHRRYPDFSDIRLEAL
ncbi:MAG: acireductone synthase [Wenzhouxiangellaceae bacterium]